MELQDYLFFNSKINQCKLAAEKEISLLRGQLREAENVLKDTAAARQVETLAVVVEEQRLRVDSILLGMANFLIDLYLPFAL